MGRMNHPYIIRREGFGPLGPMPHVSPSYHLATEMFHREPMTINTFVSIGVPLRFLDSS
jgi:hypothetical protein